MVPRQFNRDISFIFGNVMAAFNMHAFQFASLNLSGQYKLLSHDVGFGVVA